MQLGALQAAEQAPRHWTMLGGCKVEAPWDDSDSRAGMSNGEWKHGCGHHDQSPDSHELSHRQVSTASYPSAHKDENTQYLIWKVLEVQITTSFRVNSNLLILCRQDAVPVPWNISLCRSLLITQSKILRATMKPIVFLTLIVGLVSPVVEGSDRVHKQARRPQPGNEYKADTAHPSLKLDKVNLQQVPQSFVAADSNEGPVSALSPRAPNAAVYECRNSSPFPGDSDCNSIIDNVLVLDTPLIITANSCLLFQFGTCWGFFCSLCETLSTDTSFVGNQLISAEALCVANGQIGTVIGTDAPQWQAGFVYQGSSLPDYDVC
ncbi:hypothetical protein GGR54DRAFT_650687 [Hypoxylon sp. NC1633]|nr:hypothetical protein GGR54DRAFT_650687 [Hypoxylon sp. NC1633]